MSTINLNESSEYLTTNGIVEGSYTSTGIYKDITDFITVLNNTSSANFQIDPNPESFRNDISAINAALINYKTILISLQTALNTIDSNSNIPDFSKSDMPISDVSNVTALINNINGTTGGYTFSELNTYFQSATGSEPSFDTMIGYTLTRITSIRTSIQARILSDYLKNIEIIGGLNTWRSFWIKERINKPSGSLAKRKAMEESLAIINQDIANKNATISVLLASSSSEWIPKPVIVTSFYNPTVYTESEIVYMVKKNTVIFNGQEHAASYKVYRKTKTQAELDGFNNATQWGEEYNVSSSLTETEYNDTDILLNEIYMYRIQTINESNASLQSNITSSSVSVTNIESNTEIKIPQLIEGYILINNKIVHIEEYKEIDNYFYLTLSEEISGTPTEIFPLTNVASPVFDFN